MKSLDAKALPIDSLRKLPREELHKLATEGTSILKTAKDATDAHKSSTPAMGKVV